MPLTPEQVLQNRNRFIKLVGQGGFRVVYHDWKPLLILLFLLAVSLFVEGCISPAKIPTPTSTFTPISDTPIPTLTLTPIPATPTPEMLVEKEVFVPAGPFLMGSKQGDVGAGANEWPQRTVTLDAFWIDRTEVTNAMYARCVADGACQQPGNPGSPSGRLYYNNPQSQYANFPVIYINWHDASAYCAWAGRRLPTEAEWENAARGTDGRTWPWGNQQPTCDLLNFNYNCVGDTTEVGSHPGGASPYGALDMAGNVWEWVQDWYDENYYQSGPSENPTGSASGQYRVLRGGSWEDLWMRVRAANRQPYVPTDGIFNVGFRCARSP